MKLQSIDGALPTQQMLQAIAEPLPTDESKLAMGNCVAMLVQLTAALAGCGAIHWIMS